MDWPGKQAENVGDGWWKVIINQNAATNKFNIIFHNNAGTQVGDPEVSRQSGNYMAMDGAIYTTQAEAEATMSKTTVYFYNSEGWDTVYAHAYNDDDNFLLGTDWPGEAATNEGDGWWKIDVPASAFTIIFHNYDGTQTAGIYITKNNCIVALDEEKGTNENEEPYVKMYPSRADAEVALGDKTGTTVYFYNSDDWASVYAHSYIGDTPVEGVNWPGREATQAAEVGEGWWKVVIPVDATQSSFNVMFNDNAANKTTAPLAERLDTNYMTVKGEIFETAEEAEASLLTTVYFLNTGGWSKVYATATTESGTILEKTEATQASKLGEDWWQVTVPVNGVSDPFAITFSDDGTNQQSADIKVQEAYVTGKGSGVYTNAPNAEIAIGLITPTKIYFYNSDNWTEVGVHAYGARGDLTGKWGSTKMTASTTLGEGWYEATINEAPEFSLIIFNTANDKEDRTEQTAKDTTNVYFTLVGNCASAKDAEAAVADPPNTRVWFYNMHGYETVHAYIYNGPGNIFGGFPGKEATRDGETDWWYVDVPYEGTFNVQFSDGVEDKQEGYIDGSNVYLIATDKVYADKTAAENAAKNLTTMIYFLNYDGTAEKYDEVYVHAFDGTTSINGSTFPGIKATDASAEMGDYWWKAEIPVNALLTPFTVSISGGSTDTKMDDISITNYTGNYITAKGETFTTQNAADRSVGIIYETVVYFLNQQQDETSWETVGAYVYGAAGEVFGKWPGVTAVEAAEVGENWLKVTVPAKPEFSIIFHDTSDTTEKIRCEVKLTSDTAVYLAGSKVDGNMAAYSSAFEAEAAMGLVDSSLLTTVYFYNNRNWSLGDINAYTFRMIDGASVTLGSGWPGKPAEKATDLGEGWWKVLVPVKNTELSAANPFYIIFNDGVNQTEDCLITKNNQYVIATGIAYDTKEEALAAAANDTYDDGCEEGTNADLINYNVSYSGAGAALPYITYEAETASTNAEVLAKSTAYRQDIQSEASGRQAVKLDATGEYVEFTLKEATNSLVLRYSMPDSADGVGLDSTLSLYVNGAEKQDVAVTSKYAWVYGSYPYTNIPSQGQPHRYFDEARLLFDEVLPAGTTIRLQKDAADSAEYYVIDFIECELVGAPLAQPENSLSITDFGAVANDGQDDRAAIEACIAEAKAQGKEVWIPAGTFDLVEEKEIKAFGVTIRGAGMWHTNLYGPGAAFKYEGTSKFYDFALTGVSTVRDDSGDLAGFEGTGSRATNVTLQNIWMEHMKVGVWTSNTDGMVIQGCRVRNTYADGINLNSATSNTTIRNNSVRNTGDDCIAIWPSLADATGNVIEHNTIQVPCLANGIAIYGGGYNVVDSNHIADIINNGAGIVVGSEFDTKYGYTYPITVKNNLLDRCGSMQTDENYQIGAIWIWSSWSPMTSGYDVYNNTMNDCPQVGITIECNSELTGLNIQNNTINGAQYAIFEYLKGTGSGKIGNLTVDGVLVKELTDKIWKDDAPNFILTLVDEEIKDDTSSGSTGSIEGDSSTEGGAIPEEEEKYKDAVEASEGIELSSSTKELVESVLTDYELARLEDGVKIYIDIVSSKMGLPDDEQKLINGVLGNLKIGTVFDIDIFKVIDNTRWQLTELKNEILLTIDIPAEDLAKGSEFWMFRIHEDADGKKVVTRLDDLDDNPNTITIKTGLFSTYALAYKEKAGDNGSQNDGTGSTDATVESSNVTSPKTGDDNVIIWACVALAVGAVLLGYYKKTSVKRENE